MIPEVDEYLRSHPKWHKELLCLRGIVLGCQLTETVKWRTPCYTSRGKNIVLISGLRDCCVLSFMKGALLTDTDNILASPGENSRVGRLIRFTELKTIVDLEPKLKALIAEAIEVENAGLKVRLQDDAKLSVPHELQQKFDEIPAAKIAFAALTPGRQRGYLLYFAGAKQAKTRMARVEKCVPRILDAKGLNDCNCGLSKKMPACDGSHKTVPG